MVKVKICGITNYKDAMDAVLAGADALGFVFYKKSPRYISPDRAKEIIKLLPRYIIRVGVFANAQEKTIKRIAKLCNLNMLQFHGNESGEFCKRFPDYKIIKAFRIKDEIDLEQLLSYKTFAYLFDTFVESKIGGTGKIFDWSLLTKKRAIIKKTIFLSGGLNEKNVLLAIKAIKPEWVDASSFLEKQPGIKDADRVKKFIKTAKSKDNSLAAERG